jgi:hypothetical protein
VWLLIALNHKEGMKMRLLIVLCVLLVSGCVTYDGNDFQSLRREIHQLGKAKNSEIRKFVVEFDSKENGRKLTLRIEHSIVKSPVWRIRINGADIEFLKEGEINSYISIAPKTIKDGKNTIEIFRLGRKDKSRVTVSNIQLHDRPLHEVLNLSEVILSVTDTKTKKYVPSRITIVDANKKIVSIYITRTHHTALRRGVLYTAGSPTKIELPTGQYTVYATRGTEWGLAQESLIVGNSTKNKISLKLSREVDTTGFVASDTHIHTLTHSGHGTASVEERIMSLAGEGIELAIATDHNHNTDYQPIQSKLKMSKYFTSVVGNEVSTHVSNGHINAFPLDPEDEIVDVKLKSWDLLYESMKKKGAKVTILNHPRWPNSNSPFLVKKLNRILGSFESGITMPFDAIEVINSDTRSYDGKDEDILYVMEDWMSLLNHGNTAKAVGSSDSHVIGRVVVGQGRTYVKSSTDVPDKLNVDELCQAFVDGRTTVSLGIVTDILIAGKYGLGSTYSVKSKMAIPVKVRVAANSWVTPRTVYLYLNGQIIAKKTIVKTRGQAIDVWIDFAISPPKHDAHIVALVMGDPIKEPYWNMLLSNTLAMTNPVYLDMDNDGQYSSAQKTAQSIIKSLKNDIPLILASLKTEDPVIGVQVVDQLLHNASENDLKIIKKSAKELATTQPLYKTFNAPKAKKTNK